MTNSKPIYKHIVGLIAEPANKVRFLVKL